MFQMGGGVSTPFFLIHLEIGHRDSQAMTRQPPNTSTPSASVASSTGWNEQGRGGPTIM